MNSKGILILGIVFIFLLNVIAVHNYIDSYYYKAPQSDTKTNSSFTGVFNSIVKKTKSIVTNNENNSERKVKKIVLHSDKPKENEISKLKDIDKKVVKYISNSDGHDKNESKNEDKKIIKKVESKIKKDIKKEKKGVVDELDKDAVIVLNLNIKDKYLPNNPIIKKIASKMNSKRVVKIKIYQFNTTIKSYLHDIKSDLVDKGVNIDDIKVIFHQNDDKKDKIKILLTKKD